VTAVDSLILFQTAGMNFVLNFNSPFIAIFLSSRHHCKYDWLEWLAAAAPGTNLEYWQS